VHVEIERKFVPVALPLDVKLGPAVEMRQGYLAEEGETTVRLRVADGMATLTIKAGRGLTRTEVEIPITTSQAEALWPATAGRRVEKVRHRVVLDSGHVAEIDLYAGDLAGLCTIEVEFASVDEAHEFDPPAWFGADVTGDRRWSNNALARTGRPESS
jgi:adenylate cyclase